MQPHKIVQPPIVVGQLGLISVNGLENCNNAEVFLAADISNIRCEALVVV